MAVCSVDSQTLQPVACEDYDPRNWKECEWSLGFEGEGEHGVGRHGIHGVGGRTMSMCHHASTCVAQQLRFCKKGVAAASKRVNTGRNPSSPVTTYVAVQQRPSNHAGAAAAAAAVGQSTTLQLERGVQQLTPASDGLVSSCTCLLHRCS